MRVLLFFALFCLLLAPALCKCAFSSKDVEHNSLGFVHVPIWFETTPRTDGPKALMATSVAISDIAIIPLGNVQVNSPEGDLHAAYVYAFTRMQQTSARFVLYPEPFVMNGTNFVDGALINIKPYDLPEESSSDYFFYLHNSGIDLSRSKGLYDRSIAVLRVEGSVPPSTVKTDLTWESSYFCDALRTYLGKYPECFTVSRYYEYDPSGSAFVYVTPEDIAENFLSAENFGVLILPDIFYGSSDIIMGRMNATTEKSGGNNAVDRILSWVDNGGQIYASAKGQLLVEKMGLLKAGYVDTDWVLTPRSASSGRASGALAGGSSWEKSAGTFSLPTYSGASPGPLETYLLNTYMTQLSADPDVTVLANFNGYDNLRKTNGVSRRVLSEADRLSLPLLAVKISGKGKILLASHQPITVHSSDYFPWFYDSLFCMFSRQVLVESAAIFDVSDKSQIIGRSGLTIIPGLETDILISCSADIVNLYSTPMTDVSLMIYVKSGLEVFEPALPAGCVMDSTFTSTYWSSRFTCDIVNVAPYERLPIVYKVKVVDELFTQLKYYLTVSAQYLSYTDSELSTSVPYFQVGWLQVHGLMAAHIRLDVNPDPLSYYPLKGKGVYMDNVIVAENKEDTRGCDMHMITIVPLVSPLQDGGDQASPAKKIELFDRYYDGSYHQIDSNKDYIFPFVTEGVDYDILDYQRLSSIKAILAADWDTPVKLFKRSRDDYAVSDLPGATSIGDVTNANMATNIDNLGVVLKQLFYGNGLSDAYYEHASQRQLVYLDTTTVLGATTYYSDTSNWPSGMPASVINTRKGDGSAREKMFFVRNDVYFYDQGDSGQNYPLPRGMTRENEDYNTVFSIDRFPMGGVEIPCVNGTGKARSRIVREGYFDSSRQFGILPNEWSNELRGDCARRFEFWEDIDSLGYEGVSTTYYLFPIPDTSVDYRDFVGFDTPSSDIDNGRCLENYTNICVTKAHTTEFLLPPETSRKGGKIVLNFPSGFSIFPSGGRTLEECITFSADQVAFTKTEVLSTSPNLVLEAFFTRGNMPNEAYGKDSVLSVTVLGGMGGMSSFNVSAEVYRLLYDFTADPSTGYKNYDELSANLTLSVNFNPFLYLPALKLDFSMTEFLEEDNCIEAYEWLEPFVRFGVYMQELEDHATVWGSAEVHHISDAGYTTLSGGHSSLTHIGSSSIPFREYLTTGSSQVIPHVGSTGRVEWTDIWGRQWAQPVRTVEFDWPPIPPPERQFMMQTTFELLDKETGERYLEWSSDENVDIHVQIKLYNHYPKYFEITTCGDNSVPVLKKDGYRSRIFDLGDVTEYTGTENDVWISLGHTSRYGSCFAESGSKLEGILLSASQRSSISTVELCDPDTVLTSTCPSPPSGLPSVTRYDGNDPSAEGGENWMISPSVDRYYPENYIDDSMWDLTHYDYDDTAFDKAYKYHMDNRLSNIDNTILRPHNIIATPIFKGLGYSISFDRNYTQTRFAPYYHSWWSDNLQNRDYTLLTQQVIASNPISVDKELLLRDSDWIDIVDLSDASSRITSSNQNIYGCKFNRRRVRVSPTADRNEAVVNALVNNVVPVPPYLTKTHDDLTNYNCDLDKPMYEPQDIFEFDNSVLTDSARDWLYFAANLRGGARETINVVMNIDALKDAAVPEESLMTKVHDGGRFVYWNPCCGPNAFMIVDNPVNVIQSIRNDITVISELFPSQVSTLNPVIYHLLRIRDIPEINREVIDTVLNTQYGFGDSDASIYIGGVGGTSMKLNPGDMTFVKIDLLNNAGYDWDLKKNGIIAEDLEQTALNAYDLLFRIQRTVQRPLAYNFLKVTVPPEIEPFVTLVPADHNIRTAATYWDFPFINVLRIRDGYRGVYYFNVTISSEFPSELRGAIWEIEVEIDTQYFDRFPGCPYSATPVLNSCYDPVSVISPYKTNNRYAPVNHDYEFKIPNIKLAILNSGGHAYYTSGFASHVTISHCIPDTLNFVSAARLPVNLLSELREISVNGDTDESDSTMDLDEFYDTVLGDKFGFPIEPNATLSSLVMNFPLTDYTNDGLFPSPTGVGIPDDAQYYLLVKTYAEYLSYGTFEASLGSGGSFVGWNDKPKEIEEYRSLTVDVRGPWMQVSYAGKVISRYSNEETLDQQIHPGKEGLVEIEVTVTNVGSDTAFNVSLGLVLPNDFISLESVVSPDNVASEMIHLPLDPFDSTLSMKDELRLHFQTALNPGMPYSVTLRMLYSGGNGDDSSDLPYTPIPPSPPSGSGDDETDVLAASGPGANTSFPNIVFVSKSRIFVAKSHLSGSDHVILPGAGELSFPMGYGPYLKLVAEGIPPRSVRLTAVRVFNDSVVIPDVDGAWGYTFYRKDVYAGGSWGMIGSGHSKDNFVVTELFASTNGYHTLTSLFYVVLDEELTPSFATSPPTFMVLAESDLFTWVNMDDRLADWWIIVPILFVMCVPALLMFAYKKAPPKPVKEAKAPVTILEPELGDEFVLPAGAVGAAETPIAKPANAPSKKSKKKGLSRQELIERELKELEEGLAMDFVLPADQMPPAPVPPPPPPAVRIPSAPTTAALRSMP